MAGTDASEGQAVWQPGGAEEDSRLREGNRHLHLAYDDEVVVVKEAATLIAGAAADVLYWANLLYVCGYGVSAGS